MLVKQNYGVKLRYIVDDGPSIRRRMVFLEADTDAPPEDEMRHIEGRGRILCMSITSLYTHHLCTLIDSVLHVPLGLLYSPPILIFYYVLL